MKTYYWKRVKGASVSEGKYSLLRRILDRVLFGAKYTKIAEWRDDL